MKESKIGHGSEAKGLVCRFGGEAMGSIDDLCLHLMYLDYPFPAASMYFNYDDYGPAVLTRYFNAPLEHETLTNAVDFILSTCYVELL